MTGRPIFHGYVRPDGSVGIRNHVLVLPGGLISEKICAFVPGAKTIATARSGGGLTSRDREALGRVLSGLGANANVAAVLVHDGSPGAGYPELGAERLAAEVEKTGKPMALVRVGAEGGTLEAIARGIRLVRKMVHEASRLRREPVGLQHLALAVKCGASDPTSGMAGNPVVGRLFDRVVEAGGTVLFGETTELIGAEPLLAKRAVDGRVAEELLASVRALEERILATGEDIRTINPVPENIAAGISTLEEKSLGAVSKAGSHPIQGVLRYGERPLGKGLYFMDSWMAPSSIFPGFAAAGAQLLLFQYGGGAASRTILDPSPAVVAPLLWASANPRTFERVGESLDFYSGTVMEGTESLDAAGERLLRLVLDVASGTLTLGETVCHGEPIEAYGVDPLF
ncbi:MAG: UxaA family hydrolase [Deltaproteobacteria bacterium]|nr:UxaA family hydrolase [Deltaproteobacteria bacterium]